MSAITNSERSITSTLAIKSSDLVSFLRQKEADQRIHMRALSLLAYPTSALGSVATVVTSSIGCLVTGAVSTVKSLATHDTNTPFFPSLPSTISRIELAVGRVLMPFPYRSIQYLALQLIDHNVRSAVHILSKRGEAKSLMAIEGLDVFQTELDKITTTIITEKNQLLEKVREDLKYCIQAKRADTESILLTYFEQLLVDADPKHFLIVIEELLINTILFLHRYDDTFNVTKETCMAIGRMLQPTKELFYANRLEKNIEESVRALLANEKAMRFLGGGRAIIGRARIYEMHPDAKRMVCVAAVLLEVDDDEINNCPAPARKVKIEEARRIISSQEDSLKLIMKLAFSNDNRRETELIRWLVDDMINGPYLNLTFFDLAERKTILKEVNRFERCWNRGKTSLQEI